MKVNGCQDIEIAQSIPFQISAIQFATSYQLVPVSTCYHRNEQQKRRAYDQWVHDVEMGCFSPLVFSVAGACGPTADVVLKRLASCIATHQGKPYSHMRCGFDAILVFL